MKAASVNTENFASTVLQSSVPVLVDFWATWCAPCRQIGPVIDELAEETEGKALVVKVNVEDDSDIAAQFGVERIPTLLIFRGGKVVQTFEGVQSKSKLSAALLG